MTDHTKIADSLISTILVTCQNMRRPKTPEEKQLLVKHWAGALSQTDYPPNVYEDALSSWLASAKAGDSPPYPGDILRHCRLVIERIESDPVRGPKLLEWREARRRERDRLLGQN